MNNNNKKWNWPDGEWAPQEDGEQQQDFREWDIFMNEISFPQQHVQKLRAKAVDSGQPVGDAHTFTS